MKKLLSWLLVLSMAFTLFPSAVFAVEKQDSAPEAFYAECAAGDVLVRASAPAGVFPAGTQMSVTLLEDDAQAAPAIDAAVEEARGEEKDIAATYAFDIVFRNEKGREIQPDTAFGNVAVSFALAEADNGGLEADVYHVEEERRGGLTAEPVEAEMQDGEVLVEAESFSYYVVQFTYKTTEYRFVNYDAILLDDLLASVGIPYDPSAGDVIDEDTGAASDDEGIVYVWYSDGVYGETDETEGYYGWVLEPVSGGTARITVNILAADAEDDDDIDTYTVSIAVAEKNDTEKVISSGIPEEFNGSVDVRMQEYTGSVDFSDRLVMNWPEHVDDISIDFYADEAYYPEDVLSILESHADVLCPETYFDGEEWDLYRGTSRNYPVFEYYPTLNMDDFDSEIDFIRNLVQVLPFAVLVPANEEPEFFAHFDSGEGVALMLTNYGYVADNMYHLFCDESNAKASRNPYKELGLTMERSLLAPTEPVELKAVYGYLICDAGYKNYGYKVLHTSNTFTYSYSGPVIDWGEENINTLVGQSVDLFEGISASWVDGTPLDVEISSVWDDILDQYISVDDLDFYHVRNTGGGYDAYEILYEVYDRRENEDPEPIAGYYKMLYVRSSDETEKTFFFVPNPDGTDPVEWIRTYSEEYYDKYYDGYYSDSYHPHVEAAILSDADLVRRINDGSFVPGMNMMSYSDWELDDLPHVFADSSKLFDEIREHIYIANGELLGEYDLNYDLYNGTMKLQKADPESIELVSAEIDLSMLSTTDEYDAPFDWTGFLDELYEAELGMDYEEALACLNDPSTDVNTRMGIELLMLEAAQLCGMEGFPVRLVYEISDPETDAVLGQVAVDAYLFPTLEMLELMVEYDFESAFSAGGAIALRLNHTYAMPMDTLAAMEFGGSNVAVKGDRNFWLCLFMDYLNGTLTTDGLPTEEDELEFTRDITFILATLNGCFEETSYFIDEYEIEEDYDPWTYFQTGVYDYYYDLSSVSAGIGSDVPLIVSGQFDIDTVGRYHIVFTPVINGVADEDMRVEFNIEVIEPPEADVSFSGMSDRTVYCRTDYTVEQFNELLLEGVSAKTEMNVSAETRPILTEGKDVTGTEKVYYAEDGKTVVTDPTMEDILRNLAEGDTYRILYKAVHPSNAALVFSTEEEPAVYLTIRQTETEFVGADKLEISTCELVDAEAALYSGVSANVYDFAGGERGDLLEKISNVCITGVTCGGEDVSSFDTLKTAVGTYLVTYEVTPECTGIPCTKVREVVVSDGESDATLRMWVPAFHGQTWTKENMTDAIHFNLGSYGEDRLTLEVYFASNADNGEIAITNPGLTVHIPYGFEYIVPTDSSRQFCMVSPEIVGSCTDPDGYEIIYTASSSWKKPTGSIELKPRLDLLYPAFMEDGLNEYAFHAQSYSDGKPYGDCVGAAFSLISDDVAASEQNFAITAGTQTFTPNELFANSIFTGGTVYNCEEQVSAYRITVEKDAGTLPAPDWCLQFALPAAMANTITYNSSADSYPYVLVMKDAQGEVIAEQRDLTPYVKDGKLIFRLYDGGRYTFERYDGRQITYMDAVRAAKTLELEIRFSQLIADPASFRVNLPGTAVGSRAVMTGSPVSVCCGMESGETRIIASSAQPIGICLVNATDSVVTADNPDASVAYLRSYMGNSTISTYDFTNNDETSSIAAGAEALAISIVAQSNTLHPDGYVTSESWNIYPDMQMTVNYPYEYSPVSISSYDLKLYDIFYTVSNASGPVFGKTDLKFDGSFNVDAGSREYVSSVTVKYGPMIRNWRGDYSWFYGDTFSSGEGITMYPYPVMKIIAATTDVYGNPLTADKTVTVTTTAHDSNYTLTPTAQTVVIKAPGPDIRIAAADRSSYSIGVGRTSKWNAGSYYGMDVNFYVSSATRTYTDPYLILTGEALPMVDFTPNSTSYYSISGKYKVVGYSVSSSATTKGPWADPAGTWVWGSENADAVAAAAANNFADVGKITGILLDISAMSFGGRSSTEEATSQLHFNSQTLWGSSPYFADVVAGKILAGEDCTLSFEVGFHAGASDYVYGGSGKTKTITAGAVAARLTQKTPDYAVDPFAGTDNRYDFDKMEMLRVCVQNSAAGVLGSHQDCTTVFSSDGSAAGDALMSLVQGLSIIDYEWSYSSSQISSVQYEVVKADGSAETRTASVRWNYGYYNDDNAISNRGSYVGYVPFDLHAGEYVTKVTVFWAELASRTKFPDIGLVRVSQFPAKTATGYTLTAGEQLPVKVEMSYRAWTSSEGELTRIALDSSAQTWEPAYTGTVFAGAGVSAKLAVSVPEKELVSYSTVMTKPDDVSYIQGETIGIGLKSVFAFDGQNARLGSTENGIGTGLSNGSSADNFNKLRHTVFYRIAKGFTYAGIQANSANTVVSATFTENFFKADGSGDGLLKVVYSSYCASEADGVTVQLKIGLDTEIGKLVAPVKTAYLDISYDMANAVAERDYRITAAENGVQQPLGELANDNTLHICFTDALDDDDLNKIQPAENAASKYHSQPVIVSGDSRTLCGNGKASSTEENSFSLYTEIYTAADGTPQQATKDWNIYIPIPKKASAPGANDGTRTVTGFEDDGAGGKTETYAEPDMSLSLNGPVDTTGSSLGVNMVITYAVARGDALSFNGLKGEADTCPYYTAEELLQAGYSWDDVTAVRIHMDELNTRDVPCFSVDFALISKEGSGTMNASVTAMYNHKNVNGDNVYPLSNGEPYAISDGCIFELKDYYVSGTVWADANRDGLMSGETGMAGVTVSAFLETTSGLVPVAGSETLTDTDGSFTIGLPNVGTDYNYRLKVTKPNTGTSASGAWDLTKISAEGTASTRSWADPSTGLSELLCITADGASMTGANSETTALSVVNGTVTGVNFGLIEVTLSAGDFAYGTDAGALTPATAVRLAGLACNDRSGAAPAVIDDETTVASLGGVGTYVIVDEAQLAAINAQDAKGIHELTFTFHTQDEQSIVLTKTVNVSLRAKGSPITDTQPDYISAQDFEVTAGKTLSKSNARKLAYVSAIDGSGEAYPLTNIQVNSEQLAAINTLIENGTTGVSCDLSFTTPNGATVTVRVTLSQNDVKKGKLQSTAYLTAQNLTVNLSRTGADGYLNGYLADGVLTEAEFRILSGLGGMDADGYTLADDEIVVDATGLEKLNASIENRKPGIVRVSAAAGDTVIKVAVTLTDCFYITFDGNGSTNGAQVAPILVAYGDEAVLTKNTFARSEAVRDYTFAGWAAGPKGSAVYADEFTLPASTAKKLYDKAASALKADPTALYNDGVHGSYPVYPLYAAWNKVPGTSEITVTVKANEKMRDTDSTDVKISIAKDGIEEQSPVTGTLTKAEDFTETFRALDAGTYSITLSYGSRKETKNVSVAKNDKTGKVEFVTVIGDVEYKVNSTGTASGIAVEGFDGIVNGNEALLEDVISGKIGVTMALNVELVQESVQAAASKEGMTELSEALTTAYPEQAFSMVLDLSVTQTIRKLDAAGFLDTSYNSDGFVNGSKTEPISETASLLTVSIPYTIPETETGCTYKPVLFRYHKDAQGVGSTEALVCDSQKLDGHYSYQQTDARSGVITLYASKFSLYGLYLEKIQNPTPNPGPAPAPGGKCPMDATCPIEKYTDTANDAWWHDGIHFCLANELMVGFPDDLFKPNDTITRAQIVTILYRMEGEPAFMNANVFTDVEAGSWYEEAIVWASGKAIVLGYGDGQFGPNDPITREQLAAILYRYAQFKGEGFTGSWMFLLGFADRGDISAWADEAVHWCSMKEIVKGKGSDLFDPQGSATRAEAACMIQRFCEAMDK